MKNKKLLMLGTSNGTGAMVRYAQSQGIYVIVTDYLEPEKSRAKLIANEYWMINTADVDALEKKCRETNVTAVFCGVSGFNINSAMELCKRLNFPFYCTPEAIHFGRDKYDFKKICHECNAPVADDYFLPDDFTDEQAQSVKFPVVVKPVDRGANLGISFCNSIPELREAIKLVRKVSTNPKMVIERMITGEEWFSTYAIQKGVPRFLTLNAMYHEPGFPPSCYILTTTATNHIEQYLNEINEKIEEVLKRIGCTEGYAWMQVMRDVKDGKFYIIEMGYRLDGDLLYLPIKELLGYDVNKAMVDYACGIDSTSENPLPKSQKHALKKCAAGIRLWTKKACTIKKIEGLDEIAKLPGVNVETRRNVGDYEDIYRPLASITFAAADCDELGKMVDLVNKTVHFYDENDEDVIIKFTDMDNVKRIYEEGLQGR